MEFPRTIDLDATLQRKSLFLLGPRQTGKSTLLRERYPNSHLIDLLRPAKFQQYKTDPGSFAQEIDFASHKEGKHLCIVDEIQKLPELLDEVHRQIENNKELRFILTGSSARKLKKSGVNMLGGRASRFTLHPIVSHEIGIDRCVDGLERHLSYGFLPSVLLSDSPWEDLRDYVGLYLREEIQHEAIVRALDGFSRFLNVVALTNAEQVNFTQVGSDAQVPARTVREYYQVLEDTLIGYLLPAFTKTRKRKAMTSAKFYLFDPGVTNALLHRHGVSKRTREFGNLLEQFVHGEIRANRDYRHPDVQLSYWRSTSRMEVDFIVERADSSLLGIEVKAASTIADRDLKGLRAFNEDVTLQRKIVVCDAPEARLSKDGIEILPLRHFLDELWNGVVL